MTDLLSVTLAGIATSATATFVVYQAFSVKFGRSFEERRKAREEKKAAKAQAKRDKPLDSLRSLLVEQEAYYLEVLEYKRTINAICDKAAYDYATFRDDEDDCNDMYEEDIDDLYENSELRRKSSVANKFYRAYAKADAFERRKFEF